MMTNNEQQVLLCDFLPEEEAVKWRPKELTDWKWSFADYPKEKNGLKVFSCFACGGGSTMGYKLAGCEVLGCCEIDPKMNEIYIKNHHPKYNFLMDIRDFNKLPEDEIPTELYNLDILDGSPPCTTFSMAGEREKSWGKKKMFREGQKEQTLDDLSFFFIETVAKLKPKTVIMENVEGLLFGEAWRYVQRIYKEFKEAGYNVKHYLCKGEEMGIPQTRHRVFFVAIRNDIEFDLSRIDMSFNYVPITYSEIKSGVGNSLKEDSQILKWLKKAQPQDKSLKSTILREGGPGKYYGEALWWDFNIVPTIKSNGGIYRAEAKTKVSPEDIIHAQTFPEDYYFGNCKTLSRIRYICGMSVPPVMMKRVVERLIESGVYDYKKNNNRMVTK